MDKADKDILKQVLEATYEHKLLKLQYFTSEGKAGPVREIEPYSVIETKGGVMIRAYQRAPIPGWRFFHLDQIVSLAGSKETFKPRRG
ncbi:WYL domain-containing protein, partial [Candidatus Binatia bacterium]|nr:WYL domain-containing protein [Candidatus Binatia bacterium]